ncbi:hypothetical protein FOXYSP1_02359 [Fusarium oxysporum f. sp. phaseoli]
MNQVRTLKQFAARSTSANWLRALALKVQQFGQCPFQQVHRSGKLCEPLF